MRRREGEWRRREREGSEGEQISFTSTFLDTYARAESTQIVIITPRDVTGP